MKLHEDQRSRYFFDLGQRSLVFLTLNLLFSKALGLFEIDHHVKTHGCTGMKIYTNGVSHKIKMAVMSIYGVNLQNSSPSELVDRLKWNLVCSIKGSGPL